VPQADLQVLHFEVRVPRADGDVAIVEHAHHVDGEVADVAHARIDVGPRDGAGRRSLEVTEIRFFARARVRVRDVQAGSSGHGSLDSSVAAGDGRQITRAERKWLNSLQCAATMRNACFVWSAIVEDSSRPALDRLDRRILDLLQREGALPVAEVAARTGISTTTCWRRIQQLEQSGVIRGRVAVLDRAALGLDVTIFAHVKLSTQGRDAIAAFAEAIRERPEVLDCYTTMGEWDFMLRVVTRDIKAYEAFYLDHLSKLPNVQAINSSVTVTVIKETTVLPIG
jgi:Lrp/AsnC family transcriptional regulator